LIVTDTRATVESRSSIDCSGVHVVRSIAVPTLTGLGPKSCVLPVKRVSGAPDSVKIVVQLPFIRTDTTSRFIFQLSPSMPPPNVVRRPIALTSVVLSSTSWTIVFVESFPHPDASFNTN